MATADLSFDMRIKGTPEEVASILKIMLEYDQGKNGAYFSCTRITVGEQNFSVILKDNDKLMAAINGNSGTAEISALGPFGKYGELDEIDIFREMAQAAPNASFTASITGFAGYADQSLHADLSNGSLKVSTSYLSDDCRGEGELEYYSNNLPYDKFTELFKLDGEEFDEAAYEDFLSENFCCYDTIGEFFEETEYEDFIELFDAECPLTEDEYIEITEQFTDMDCETCGEYLENAGYEIRETYTYDPVEKKYIDGSGPKMKSGVAYSINDDISAYLDSVGLPSDEEAINALSVEDVYAILAGTYGKETAEEDEDSKSDDIEENDEPDAEECEEEEISEDSDEEEAEESDSFSDDNEERAQEESEENDSDDEDSDDEDGLDEEEADEQEDAAEVEPEAEAEAEAESEAIAEAEPEPAETENTSPAKKRSFPIWLVVLLIAVILVGIAAYVFGFGEAAWNYIADLLGIAQ